MRTRAELLEALEIERLDQTWWITSARTGTNDDDLTTRRRQRELVAASRHYDASLHEAREIS